MTDARTELDVVRAHRDIALREAAIAAAEADILRERVAALEGDVAAWRKLARGHCGSACTDEEHGRLLPLYAVNRVPTPATDPRQRPKNVGGPAVAAYFATPATDEARCVGCHEQGIDHPRGTEHPHR